MLETVSSSELLTEEYKAFLKDISPDTRTERGLLNVAYRQRAFSVLKDIPGCSWLCDKEKMVRGEKDAWKPTILIELGKIRDIDAMIAIALQLCDIKPKSKQGALMVKQIRLGKAEGDVVDLANEVIDTINSYSERYEMRAEGMLEALQLAYQQIEELIQDEQDDTGL
jgi:hypothetical protein